MLPAELQSLVAQIDACEHEAELLVGDLDDHAVNWTPPNGGWTIAQCLMHLALINPYYLHGWTEAVYEAASKQRGPFNSLRPTLFGRWFVRWMEPPVRIKTKTIRTLTPGPRFARAGLVETFKASHEPYRHLVRASAAVDVNRIVRPNAIIQAVKMRLSTVLLVIPAHDRRHLWQAANVKAAHRGETARGGRG